MKSNKATDTKALDQWLKAYLPNKEMVEKYLHGHCFTLAEDIVTLLGHHSNYEQWELWDLEKKYSRLPLVVEGKKLPDLCDIGEVWHVVVKWDGWYWDASGRHKTLEEKTVNYDKCPNPHWLRTE